MSKITFGSNTVDIDLFVFDKDGLLFNNHFFWTALAISRAHECEKYITKAQILELFRVMGVTVHSEKNTFVIDYIDSSGIFAVASPQEEITVTAAFLTQFAKMSWADARLCSETIFKEADSNLDFSTAIIPHAGFPSIFMRLREANIPYGIATSDTHKRALKSVQMFDDATNLSFIITPEDVEKGKPNPDMLKLIHEKTNTPFEKMAMVGDSLVDLEMAHSVGAIGIGIPQEETVKTAMLKYSPYIIETLNDIRF